MTGLRRTTVALLAFALLPAACASPEQAPDVDEHAASAEPHAMTPTAQSQENDHQPVRTQDEQEFLDTLTRLGLPTHVTAETTIEVGIGVCRSIADGAGTETILRQIRPLTDSLAAQSEQRDTDEVGRALVDASRAHLCRDAGSD